MQWLAPIFDRTQQDVEYARLNRNDSAHHKGAFSYEDMNRITGNMKYLASYAHVVVSSSDAWAPLEKPNVSNIQTLLSDLQTLRNATLGEGRAIPPRPIYQYEKINQIERLLYDIRSRLMGGTMRTLNTFELGGDLI